MGVGLLDDALELAGLLLPEWPAVRLRIRESGHPTCEGDDDANDNGGEDADADAGSDDDDSSDDSDDADKGAADDKPDGMSLEEWRRQARKWEARAKKGAKREADLAAKLAERDDADKSEHEKAVEAAARAAREEALTEAQKERRADKIEAAVVKVGAVKGVPIGDGDAVKTVKFSDPDDVQMWLEKQIDRGEVDADDIYKDGRVDEDALAGELARLAQAKPSWLVGSPLGNGKPAGDADGGKGSAAKSDTDVEATLQRIQRRRSGAPA